MIKNKNKTPTSSNRLSDLNLIKWSDFRLDFSHTIINRRFRSPRGLFLDPF